MRRGVLRVEKAGIHKTKGTETKGSKPVLRLLDVSASPVMYSVTNSCYPLQKESQLFQTIHSSLAC